MNNKGQSLVLFVLIMPLLISLIAFTIDGLMVSYEKKRIEGVIESNLKIILDNNVRDVNKIYNFFNEEMKNSDVYIKDNIIYLNVSLDKKSLFKNILELDLYNFNYYYCGNYDSKIINEKGFCA